MLYDNSTYVPFAAQLRQRTGAGALEYLLTRIGLPAELLAGLRGTPHWQAMVSVAHTVVYDSQLSEATGADLLRRASVPALVIDSADSIANLTGMAATGQTAAPTTPTAACPATSASCRRRR